MKINSVPTSAIVLGTALAMATASPAPAHNAGHEHGDGQEGKLASQGMKKLEQGANPKAGLRRYSPNSRVRSLNGGSPDQVGQWSPIIDMPIVPIFMALLPNGKVLMWDSVGELPNENYPEQTTTRAAVWDPNTNTSVRIDLSGFNIFCAGFAHLADGRVFVAGGNKNVNLDGIRQTHFFDFNTNSWSRGPDMAYERWYPSVAALPNGEQFVMGGGPNTHEVYQINNVMRTLTTAIFGHNREYPFIQTNVDGRVFYAGPRRQMRAINTAGTGSWQVFGNRDGIDRSYGSYVMYGIGRFLVAGGGLPPTNTARLVNVSSGAPASYATGNMIYARRQHNLTVLPNGTVLATGGLNSNASLVDLNAGVYAAEVWNPATGAWRELASAEVTRQYHSVAMLLPDGRVLTGGGGICLDCQAAGYLRKDIEIFSPPYLFRPDGSGELATRPTITSAPTAFTYNQPLTIDTPDATSIARVSLVRLGAPTHGQDQGQRQIPLTFSASTGQVNATAPANANIAPPGYYMLFILNSSGVPSVASMVQVQSSSPTGNSFVSTAVARHSNRCLDVPNAQLVDGVQLQQWSCNGGNSQNFQFRPIAGTTNTYNLVNVNSNKCLVVQGAALSDGAKILQSTCGGSTNQQFRLESMGDSYYRLVAVHSNKCAVVGGGPTATGDGAKIVQWTCNTNPNHQWRITIP
ncbi:MAG: RICIN domain-containing protein [Cyanosarcina radialis HA8281-LM2]|jgi:WD40 repeat protein|nr:RICIN domain-containing protein [Cyanosarcina radialis HA8281-LM2]